MEVALPLLLAGAVQEIDLDPKREFALDTHRTLHSTSLITHIAIFSDYSSICREEYVLQTFVFTTFIAKTC